MPLIEVMLAAQIATGAFAPEKQQVLDQALAHVESTYFVEGKSSCAGFSEQIKPLDPDWLPKYKFGAFSSLMYDRKTKEISIYLRPEAIPDSYDPKDKSAGSLQAILFHELVAKRDKCRFFNSYDFATRAMMTPKDQYPGLGKVIESIEGVPWPTWMTEMAAYAAEYAVFEKEALPDHLKAMLSKIIKPEHFKKTK